MVHFRIDPAECAIFLAILLRLSIIVFMIPIFNSSQVPRPVKVCTIVALSLMLYPMLRRIVTPLPAEPLALAGVVFSELIFGIIFSLSILFLFSAFQAAGELISFEMGFGFAQVADPQNGSQTMLLSMWFQMFAMLLLFSINGHHIILRTVIESFRTVPVGAFSLTPEVYQSVIGLSGQLFLIAIKIAAPVMIVLLLTQAGLGLMSKFAPQVNVLMTSFPLTIVIGLSFMTASLIAWGSSMERFLKDLFMFLRYLTG